MVTRVAFVILVALVGVQRLSELGTSRRNVARMLARGGREHAPEQMKWMTLLHVGWLVAMPVEVLALGRPFWWPLALVATLVFAVGQGLRLAAKHALGELWTVRIVTVPNAPVVEDGVYRVLRHPNYVGVALEIAALPLVHGAWLTAIVFSALNAVVLTRRIRAEERALREDTDYDAAFRDRPRIFPDRSSWGRT